MRILFDHQIFGLQKYGGISRYFCELATNLARRPKVKPVICAPLYVNAYLDNMQSSIRRGFRSPITNRMYYLRRAVHIAAEEFITRSFRPDVIHETYYARKVRGPSQVPRVVTVYDMIHERFPEHFNFDDVTSDLKAEAVRRADHVICISECTRQDLIEILGVPSKKVSVTYLASDLPAAPSMLYAPPPHPRPYILYVGQRSGYKNFGPMLRAVQSSPLLQELDVVCFGGGAICQRERENLSQTGFPPERLQHISGDDSALSRYYSGARCFVYPSLYEGFGIPPLEAMANDCPVVCSESSSIPEVVGAAGEYFDPGSLESMRAAIERVALSNARCSELVRAGRARRSEFSWDRCADQTLAVYKQCTT